MYKRISWIGVGLVMILWFALTSGLSAEKTITIWTPAWEMDRKAGNPWEWIYSEFERDNPGVKIEVVFYSTPLMDKLLPAFAAGTEPDLSFMMMSEVPFFVGRDLLEPLPQDIQEELSEKAVKAVVDFYTWEGKMYGYPYWWDLYVLNWNKDMFEEAGLDPDRAPKTWDEFRDFAKILTKRDNAGEISRVGYAIRYLGQPLGIIDKIGSFLFQKGVNVIDPPDKLHEGKPGFNNEAGVEVFDLYRKMLQEDKSTAFGFPDPRVALLQGKAAMQISESSAIAYRAPSEAPDLKWGQAAIPYPEDGKKGSAITAHWISVSNRSENKEKVFEFFRYLMRPQSDQFMHVANYNNVLGFGQLPILKQTWDHAWFGGMNSYYAQLQNEVMPYAGRLAPINVKSTEAVYEVGQYMVKVWEGKMSAEEAVQEAAANVQKILEAK